MNKKIGILELAAGPSNDWRASVIGFVERKQFVAVTPQAIAVWCRQMGHEVHYATYWGNGDPKARLPDDLDVVFISCFSCLAPLAYALAKVYRRQGVRTVLGGPHARCFPRDALRYFDLVVLECDQPLIADIIADRFEPHSVISSPKPFVDMPTIEERLPEIYASVFWRGRPSLFTAVPLLASIGCPYNCNFCVDWNRPYQPLPADRLAEDLRFASQHLPGTMLFFCDPNFAIRFDETLSVFDSIPPAQRSPYVMESSLSNLRRLDRLQRLRDTHCIAVGPGIEAWSQYSNKAGVGQATSRDKLEQVVEHLQVIETYVPYIQTNFILGVDTDRGDEPFELTRELLSRTPFNYPTLNIPVAFGGTPQFSAMLKAGRILTTMPFSFYWAPHLTLILQNYDASIYFRKMVDLYDLLLSGALQRKRLMAKTSRFVKLVNLYRDFAYDVLRTALRTTARHLEEDRELRAFHAGESQVLPEYYAGLYRRSLGRYAEVMPIEESQPLLEDEAVVPLMGTGAALRYESVAVEVPAAG